MSNVTDPQALLKTIRNLHDHSWSIGAVPLATHASMQSTTWTLGILPNVQHPQLRQQIRDIAFHSTHHNPFFELPILEPSIQHLAKGDVQFLYLSEKTGNHESLKLIAPVRLEKTTLFRRPVLRVWSQIYAPLGHPLVSGRKFDETIEALIQCLNNPTSPEPAVLLIDDMPLESQFCSALYNSPALAQSLFRFSFSERASFNAVPGKSYDEAHVSGKRRQRLRKMSEHLSKVGKISFSRATTTRTILPAFETMLELEASSWKGKRGTALMLDENVAAMARQSVEAMADANQCEIFSLLVDDRALASTVVYKSRGSYFPWKTAFDETMARYSVGNLLVSHINQALSVSENFRELDSLAAQDNQTANRFWPDRLALCSMTIGIGKGGDMLAEKVMRELLAQRQAKAFAKKLLRR